MKTSQLKANPKNPRIIRDDKFKKLVASIEGFPEMMEKRPMVCVTDVDGKLFPLGGNMRLRAIQELGMKEIPDSWVTLADDWTQEKRAEFTIKDNASFGEWNYDDLANEWDAEQLSDWGVDVPKIPDFDAGTMDDQGSLDEIAPKFIDCPHCGKEFDVNAKN
jgi:ParB-like chromosome segregation protein Spo0J